MSTAQLLVLHREHGLKLDEISLILEIPRWKIRDQLRGRIKPKRSKRSWIRGKTNKE